MAQLITHSLQERTDLIDQDIREEELSASDRDMSNKTILAYYVYSHSYSYTENGLRRQDVEAVIDAPLKTKCV